MQSNFNNSSNPVNQNFQKWFEGSKTVDEDGEPLVLYHGTHSNFNVFNINYVSSENYFGKGFYFSNSESDADSNYASSDGKDRELRISKIFDSILDIVSPADLDELKNSDDFDPSAYVSLSELLYELKSWKNDVENFEHNLIMDKLINYLMDINLVINENDFTYDIAYRMHDTLFDSNYLEDNRVITAFVKMVKPFDVNNFKITSSYEITGDFRTLIDNFEKLNQANNSITDFMEFLKSNIGYYINDYDRETCEGVIYKESLYEIFGVEVDDDELNFENAQFDEFLITKFIEYFYDEFGDSIDINYVDTSFITQFFNFIKDVKQLDVENMGEESLEILQNRLLEYDFVDFSYFDEIMRASDLFIDNIDNPNSYMQSFSEFIQTLGYDGIIMKASIFSNMNFVDAETNHYIVFNPNNIKLADGSNKDFSLLDNDIRYKAAIEIPSKSINMDDTQKVIDKFHKSFPNTIQTRIFNTQKEAETYASEKCQGFYYSDNKNKQNNFVGIVLENIANMNELETVLIHEHVGHSSLKQVLKHNYEPTMLGVYDYFVRKEVFNKESLTRKDKIIKAEERLAESVENNDVHKPSLVSRLSSAITKTVRKVFPSFPVMKFDIDNMLFNNFQFARKKPKNNI